MHIFKPILSDKNLARLVLFGCMIGKRGSSTDAKYDIAQRLKKG